MSNSTDSPSFTACAIDVKKYPRNKKSWKKVKNMTKIKNVCKRWLKNVTSNFLAAEQINLTPPVSHCLAYKTMRRRRRRVKLIQLRRIHRHCSARQAKLVHISLHRTQIFYFKNVKNVTRIKNVKSVFISPIAYVTSAQQLGMHVSSTANEL